MQNRPLNWSADIHVGPDTGMGTEIIEEDDRADYVRLYFGGDGPTAPITVYLSNSDTVGRLIRQLEVAYLNMDAGHDDEPTDTVGPVIDGGDDDGPVFYEGSPFYDGEMA